ncbi:MAG TPA: TlyA family RNA methyltransferase [Acidimicrobiia bacterium]|nr:TlyA family RNA methyltransferase [Acidimicrobiia bacterium]
MLRLKEHRSSGQIAMRRRLDLELVRRGLTESRARAQEAIAAGLVLVSGTRADRPGRLVSPDEPVHLEAPPTRFVSRGGEKLAAALDRFAVAVEGRTALDAGASTGGFTDCLLQRGAASVVAVDVGTGQLAWSLRNDPRVTVRERCNVRHLTLADLGGEPVDLVVGDLSFISLRLVAAALAGVARPGADVVLLIKPQFEAGRAQVRRGGLVTDPAVHRSVLETVTTALAGEGLAPLAVTPSPLRGASGNIEFLGHFRVRPGASGLDPEVIAAVVEDGHR